MIPLHIVVPLAVAAAPMTVPMALGIGLFSMVAGRGVNRLSRVKRLVELSRSILLPRSVLGEPKIPARKFH